MEAVTQRKKESVMLSVEAQRVSEDAIVQKKLDRMNESLKGISIEQIRQAAAKAQEEKTQ